MHKGTWNGPRLLDGKEVSRITPYLDDSEMLSNPFRLKENASKSFQGSIVLGMGFVLEPDEAQVLISKDRKNNGVLFPYLSGEDLNSRPNQSPSRWVINFFDWPEEKAREYKDCFSIVEEKVKPERTRRDELGKFELRKPLPEKWWIYADKRPALYRAIASLEKVMVISRVSKHAVVALSDAKPVFSDSTVVITLADNEMFALMQSTPHAEWAWKYCSTMEGRLRYTPSDIFETFPFPACLRDGSTFDTSALQSIGREYYEHRQALMLDMQLGLTKTYNLFHDLGIAPGATNLSTLESQLKKFGAKIGAEEAVTRIQTLRDLQVKMDTTVLAAYGWTDIILGHGSHAVDFLPENDRVRFTISPQARREVLKRLLELNHRYHAEEEAEEDVKLKKTAKRTKVGHSPELGL